jgi:hypothetical protein
MSAPAPKVLWEPHGNMGATFVELLGKALVGSNMPQRYLPRDSSKGMV